MLQGTVFNIPETDALGRTTVLRYMAVYGATRLEIFHDGAWKTFLEGNGRFSPGFKMPGGSYRVIRESSNNPWVAYGYMASPPPNNYSAIDEYPDSSRLWTFHSLMAGSLEFTVPATKVYMLTMISSGNRIDRFEGGSWVTYADGDLPYTLEPPGIRLPAGQYRMEQSSPTAPVWCGGYVTTES